MTKPNNERKRILIAVAALLLIAYICRIPGIGGRFSRELGLIRSAIYMGLFLAWGLSVRSRILQTQARRYMTAIACLMIFWFLVRTLKFHFLTSDRYPDAARYLWYLYYLPMLFIPLLSVFVAFSIGKPEDYHLPKRAALLLLPTAMLFLLVMTNDLHQRVFTFPRGMTGENGYAVGYYLVGGWLTICALMLLFVLYHKCRIPGSRRRILLPCLPIVILILYAVLHYSQMEWVRFVAGDMTAVMCLMYAATLELCIQCRFIQSNTHYRELFDASTVGAQIADGDNHVCLRSQAANHLPEAVLRQDLERKLRRQRRNGELDASGGRFLGQYGLYGDLHGRGYPDLLVYGRKWRYCAVRDLRGRYLYDILTAAAPRASHKRKGVAKQGAQNHCEHERLYFF